MYASGEYAIGDDTDAYDDNDPSALHGLPRRARRPRHVERRPDVRHGLGPAPRARSARDFVPYTTAGHWVYDDDYVWVSDYDWGWAPFHYGRWV